MFPYRSRLSHSDELATTKDPWMSLERAPFLLFFGAVVCAGWIGGLSVGLLATAVWKAGTKSALISHNRGWIAHSG